MGLFGGKKGVIGLDIGSSSIKVAELKETKKGYGLVNFGVAPLPPEAIVDGALMNSAAIVEAIQTLINERKIKTKEVVTSVSGQSVMIKKIPLPAMTEQELEDQIQWEAEQYIPFDINDVNLDFQILKPGDDQGNMEVLLVAAKKDIINDHLAVITEAGLIPVVMDIDAFALENMYEINYQIMENEVLAVVNIGASVINIAVTKNGQYMFSRDVSSGGKLFSEEIQKQLSVSYEEAEMLKLGGSTGKDSEEVMRREVSTVIKSVSEQLSGEIARSLDFYQASAAEEHINKIWLGGGSCRIPGLAEAIQEKQNIPVEIVDPFRNIDRNPKQFDPGYLEQEIGPQAAVVIGLATRRVGDK